MSHRLPLADIKFIADFAAYARSRGDVAYDYENDQNCAICQYLVDTGRAVKPTVGPQGWLDLAKVGAGLDLSRISYPTDLIENDLSRAGTFAALADRLDAILLDAPVVERAA